jgi:hypothetical protein
LLKTLVSISQTHLLSPAGLRRRSFRPFLSYSELGALLVEPSKLYDELNSILGLGEITAAIKLLADARKQREARKKEITERLARIRSLLETTDDPRAAKCREALSGPRWDLDAVDAAVLGDAEDRDEQAAIARLRRLAQLQGPNLDQVQQAVSDLRGAIERQAELAGSSQEQNAKLASLLGAALHYHAAFAGPCPVCEGALPDDWSSQARARLEDATALAEKARDATDDLKRCTANLTRFMRPPPAPLIEVDQAGLPTDALDVWRAWADAPVEAGALCTHAESLAVDLVAAVDALRQAAEAALSSMESAWRPVARDLAAWLVGAREVLADGESLRVLKQAETWMKAAETSLRDDRFTPIADRSQEIWALLRQESSVDLSAVRLEGTGTRRKVALNVSLDGQEGVAVSVMSQGELNALALSLFLPRMTLPESPFHFVVVDDPVQAMDPHKVDGLARVLEDVARTRQVIVLTHDTRLYEAIERLGIRAKVLEVARRARSVVEIRTALDPVERHLQDAWNCLRHQDKLGPSVAGRTVPGFCRLALEAACVEAIRRRRLARGDSHADVEREIAQARGLHPLAALAIKDNANLGDQVFPYLNNKCGGRWAGNAFRDIKEGSHHGYSGSLEELLQDARKLAQTLRELR